jgi:PAS domain S-box-containing protein
MLVTRDETDRERAREALRQSEERLRTVLASAPLVLFALDAEGRFEVAAGRGLDLLGVRAAELLGAPVLELCRDVPWIVDAIRRALAGEEVRATGTFRGRTFESQYTPLRDERGKVKGLTGLALDMTERANALERLRESEGRLRRVIDSNMIGIVFWDASGPIWDANRAFLEAVGYSREELEAGRVSWIDLTPPEHRHKDEQALVEIATFGACAPFEKEYVRKDGARVPVVVGAAGLDGRSDRGVAFVLDIADRKAIEEELRKAIRVRDEFLTIASHELRTPLTTLELQLEMIERLLRKRPEEPPDDRFGRKVALALRQVERLKGLIDGLLDVSRIAMGRLELDLAEIDLGEIAREVAERFEDEAERQRCSLRVEGDSVLGLWDKVRIEQVVTNLVTNAIKYSPGTAIEVLVSGDERCATLCVRDRGIGIRSQDLARIFERFERAVSSRNYGGLGLGLYITRQVVEAHGGSIDVSSQPGEGATFTVRLPRAPAAAARRAEDDRGAELTAERS